MGRIREELRVRSIEFAVSVLSLVDGLPNTAKGWEIGRQMVRSGTAVGANLREADNALTDADFAHKCSIARKEASEIHYWLELCQRTAILRGNLFDAAIQEADELARILSAIVMRTQKHMDKKKELPCHKRIMSGQ